MEYILYYNRQPNGYGFYEKSDGFPQAYLKDVQEICNYVPEPNSNTTAMRYSPLGEMYLLTVIFRQQEGDGVQLRGVNAMVNFLLSQEDAQRLFADVSTQTLQGIMDKAKAQLEAAGVQVKNLPQAAPEACESRIPAVQLLTAASYAGAPVLGKQAYYGVDGALPEVAAMLRLLPRKLRKQVSFHTGIQSLRESIGVAVNFCAPAVLEGAYRSGMTGGMNSTNKYCYTVDSSGSLASEQADTSGFRRNNALLAVLQGLPCPELTEAYLGETVTTWQDLEALAQTQADVLLDMAVGNTPQDVLAQRLQKGEFSVETMVQLAKNKNLSEEALRAIIQNDKLTEADLLSIAQNKKVPQTCVMMLLESGKLSKHGVSQLIGLEHIRRMTGVMQTVSEDLPAPQTPQPQKQENLRPNRRQAGIRPRKEKKEMPPALTGAAKLILLAALLWAFVALVKSLLHISAAPDTEKVIFILVKVETLRIFWRVSGLVVLTAVISSFITVQVNKWKAKKEKRNSK